MSKSRSILLTLRPPASTIASTSCSFPFPAPCLQSNGHFCSPLNWGKTIVFGISGSNKNRLAILTLSNQILVSTFHLTTTCSRKFVGALQTTSGGCHYTSGILYICRVYCNYLYVDGSFHSSFRTPSKVVQLGAGYMSAAFPFSSQRKKEKSRDVPSHINGLPER